MTFNDFVGQTVLAVVPILHKIEFQTLKVHGCEAGGIWVESQVLTDMILKAIGQQTGKRTPIFFLPFHQITFAWTTLDQPSLSESAFGVSPED
jgi:hypothetical protein